MTFRGGAAMSTSGIAIETKKVTGWSILISALLILAGILAIGLPMVAGIAVNIVVAWLLVFCGVAHFIYGWDARGIGAVLWQVLLGTLYVAIGVYLLRRPVAGLITLTLALAVYLFAEGLLELILAFALRPRRGWGWILFDGLVTLALGIMIWRLWPWHTEWVIGTLVGVSMIFSGVTRLMLSIEARSLAATA
jgi:uncharacterized membrane protein HdeD (DUF308 family)